MSLMDDMEKDGEEAEDILANLQRNSARKGKHGPGHTVCVQFLGWDNTSSGRHGEQRPYLEDAAKVGLCGCTHA